MALIEQQGRAMLGLLPEATATPFSDEEGLSLVDQWYEDLSGAEPEAPPTDLVASVVAGQVVLTWTDTLTDNTGYSVQRATGAGAFAEIEAVGDVETATDAGPFDLDQQYRYKLVVAGGAQDAGDSNITAATPNRSYVGSVRSRLRRLRR